MLRSVMIITENYCRITLSKETDDTSISIKDLTGLGFISLGFILKRAYYCFIVSWVPVSLSCAVFGSTASSYCQKHYTSTSTSAPPCKMSGEHRSLRKPGQLALSPGKGRLAFRHFPFFEDPTLQGSAHVEGQGS